MAVFVVGDVRRFGHNAPKVSDRVMHDTIAKPLTERELRGANLCQTLHWLAQGRVRASELCAVYLAAIARDNPRLNAYVQVDASAAEAARAACARRDDRVLGRLDGVPISVKDNLDVAGLPTRCGLNAIPASAQRDARVVERLRHAGAVILGKTQVPEASLEASSANPHTGDAHNPFRHGFQAGGSSGGAAVAVAAGLCVAAVGTDSLGSIRIPASYCGVYSLKPTSGEVSVRGMLPAARRLDSIGLMARGVGDLAILLHVVAGYDADDPRSRQRRVDLELPDWEPGKLRVGVLGDLAAFGTEPAVATVFAGALDTIARELGNCRIVDFGDYPLRRARRAAFFLIEAEILVTHASALADAAHPPSAQLERFLDYARRKSAADCVAANHLLDAALPVSRHLFSQIDVLVTPTTPQAAFPLGTPLPDNQGDFTCFANFSGCPAVSIPMGTTRDGLPVGMQFVGPPGSDLRLLELAEVCAAALDATPAYPVGTLPAELMQRMAAGRANLRHGHGAGGAVADCALSLASRALDPGRGAADASCSPR
jgi:aspartyl-tRNA(Asn)/glutamyl-tRNA(Gln) amidotransferase subunit A